MNIALIIILLLLGLFAILIIVKSFKGLNKIKCPECKKIELEQASYNSIGSCSCGYTEDIMVFKERIKDKNYFA